MNLRKNIVKPERIGLCHIIMLDASAIGLSLKWRLVSMAATVGITDDSAGLILLAEVKSRGNFSS